MSDEQKKKSRKPDYRVKALNKVTGTKGSVGAAWLNEDKSISIVFDPFIMLQASSDLVITLFPITNE